MLNACKIKALIVDDDRINRMVTNSFLKPYGFELTEAESGSRAIELVKSTKFDIIFMDHMMPGMDGIEAVQHIRAECGENGASPIIIALTGNELEETGEKFLNNGFQDFIFKPLSKESLDELLLKWLPVSGEEAQEDEQTEKDKDEIRSVQIRGIDLEPLMRYHTGSLKDYQELLEIYCLEGKHRAGLLQNLLEQRDYTRYGIEVHGLKSASANIGAMHVSALAKEQEEAAIREDTIFIKEHFPDLLSVYRQQMEDIRFYLKEQQAGAVGENLLPGPDREALQAAIQKALEQLENFHSRECMKQIEELLEYDLDKDITAKLQEIQGQLRLYEDDVAELLFHQLLEWLDKG